VRESALAIPIAGPMVEMLAPGNKGAGLPPLYVVAFLDTAVQAGGLALAIVSPFVRRMVWRPVASR
jgi:hypothetical protein